MNQNIPSKVITVNTTCSNMIFGGYEVAGSRIRAAESRLLRKFIDYACYNRTSSVSISRKCLLKDFPDVSRVETITGIAQRLQKRGLIEIKNNGIDPVTRQWLPNTYILNWDAIFMHFGDFTDKLKGKIYSFILILRDRFFGDSRVRFTSQEAGGSRAVYAHIKNPAGSTKEEKTISIVATAPLDIAKEKKVSKGFASCFAKGCVSMKNKFALKRKEVSPTMIVPSEAEENYMVKRLPRGVAKPFDVRMTVCPQEYIEAAIKIGVHPSHISDQFCQFADYWSMRTGEKKGRKTDWPLTWRVWVTKNFGDYRLGLKNPNPSEPQLLGNSEQLVENFDELNYPEEVRGMVKKIKDRVTVPVFKSWLADCVFVREGDSYTFIVPKKLGTYKQDAIKTRFDEILMDELKMTVIYET